MKFIGWVSLISILFSVLCEGSQKVECRPVLGERVIARWRWDFRDGVQQKWESGNETALGLAAGRQQWNGQTLHLEEIRTRTRKNQGAADLVLVSRYVQHVAPSFSFLTPERGADDCARDAEKCELHFSDGLTSTTKVEIRVPSLYPGQTLRLSLNGHVIFGKLDDGAKEVRVSVDVRNVAAAEQKIANSLIVRPVSALSGDWGEVSAKKDWVFSRSSSIESQSHTEDVETAELKLSCVSTPLTAISL